MFLQTVVSAIAKLLEIPAGFGHPYYWRVERSTPCHRLKCRKDLLVREVPGGAEEYECVGMRIVHRVLLRQLSSRRVFPGALRTDSASRIATCLHSPIHRVT